MAMFISVHLMCFVYRNFTKVSQQGLHGGVAVSTLASQRLCMHWFSLGTPVSSHSPEIYLAG